MFNPVTSVACTLSVYPDTGMASREKKRRLTGHVSDMYNFHLCDKGTSRTWEMWCGIVESRNSWTGNLIIKGRLGCLSSLSDVRLDEHYMRRVDAKRENTALATYHVNSQHASPSNFISASSVLWCHAPIMSDFTTACPQNPSSVTHTPVWECWEPKPTGVWA